MLAYRPPIRTMKPLLRPYHHTCSEGQGQARLPPWSLGWQLHSSLLAALQQILLKSRLLEGGSVARNKHTPQSLGNTMRTICYMLLAQASWWPLCSVEQRAERKAVWRKALPTPGSSTECGAIPLLVQRTLSLPNSRATCINIISSFIAFRTSVFTFRLL